METILPLIAVIIILVFLIYVVKMSIKVAAAVFIAYILFNIAFIWSADETMTNLQVNRFLKEDAAQTVESSLSVFEAKREEKGVVDTEEVRRTMDQTIQFASEQGSEKTKELLAQDWSQLFAGMNKEEVRQAMEETKAIWAPVFTEKEMEEIAF